MVSQTEVTTSRIQKEHAWHHSSTKEEFSSHGNVAFCQRSPLYASWEESAASTLATLTEEAKLATVEVKALGDKALAICKSLIVGGVVGRVSRSVVAPLERLKILLQAQNPLKTKCNGTVQGLKYIWSTEGLCGIFKGNGTNCARIIPNDDVKFYIYEQASSAILWLYRRETGQEDAEITPLLRIGVGACATMSARYPMDMVRGRLIVQTEDSTVHCRRMFHEASTIMKEEGPLAVYKGWLPSIIGMIPYMGLDFVVYESLKDWLVKRNIESKPEENVDLSVLTKLGCGASAAGIVGQTMAYPLDVALRRMQMVGWKGAFFVITADDQMKAPEPVAARRTGKEAVAKTCVEELLQPLVNRSQSVVVLCKDKSTGALMVCKTNKVHASASRRLKSTKAAMKPAHDHAALTEGEGWSSLGALSLR
ncbi:hypothetical protein GOP47_0017584 [Adiantum capillus-veneris]|uniref:Mitochondrial carrier protein n=1 Tax=Adiantum capillus-veneris TaxID=13818 RepID=A0A9D4UFM4_ADICA|nr:hypothetical protein GOP47_0017584 [Adiantum capillus-veneris]